MSHLASGGAIKTYLNPIYPQSFPDPFLLKHDGRYYGYATGFADDGNVFGVITSEDLVNWVEVGGAMKPLEGAHPYYWAPEVTYSNGKFYLYYSVGNEILMEIRVAVSDRPDSGFVDSGHRLTYEDFAIDAHVFIDDDGSKYLFYATDFLEHSHIGTGTVVDRMIDWFTLAGEPRPVTRAKYDWQVYDPNRKEKGGVRWHTVEGPAVLKRKGTYFEMFSGGNWQNTTYGVSFAVTNDINAPDEWEQFCDGEKVLPILRTEPDLIVGPGHNSVVRGLNNRELYCVYHRWTDAGRVLAIDRMDFAGKRIFVVGATHTPQPIPFTPSKNGLDHAEISTSRGWTIINGNVISDPTGRTELQLNELPASFLCEITFRCGEATNENAVAGFHFATGVDGLSLILDRTANEVRLAGVGGDEAYGLSSDFDWSAKHLIRIDLDYRKLRITLDNAELPARVHFLSDPIKAVCLFSENVAFEVSSFELTEGFEELFEDEIPLASNGWNVIGNANHLVRAGELVVNSEHSFEISKHRPLQSSELSANFRLVSNNHDGEFGLLLRAGENDVLRLSLDTSNARLSVNNEPIHTIPVEVALEEYHQLRVIKSGTDVLCYFDDALLKTVEVDDEATSASVFADRVSVALDMIRLTTI